MPFTRCQRRFTAWIATLAILVGALAPAVSHALSWAAGGEVRWIEVCTVAGVKLMAVKADGAADEDGQGDPAAHPVERCPYCGTHAGSFGLPPAPATPLVLRHDSYSFPPLYYHAPRPLFAWAAAHPRAPPVLA